MSKSGFVHTAHVSAETRKRNECPRTGVKCHCELCDKGSGNSWVLCEMSKHG